MCRFFARFTGVPETANANGHHVCGREANSVILPCQNVQVKVFRPKKNPKKLGNHLRASKIQKFSLGSIPPDPPSLILCIRVQVLVQAGPMQFDFCWACVFGNMLTQHHIMYMCGHVFRGYPHEALISFSATSWPNV